MPTALESITEKLKRANEHIDKLQRELKAFWNETPNRSITDYDPESEKAFRDFHSKRLVPTPFMVTAGEVIYQFRSSLDHLVCALIIRECGSPDEQSQFPIFRYAPTDADDIRRYKRQVRGISNPEVLAYIERAQPYQAGNNRDRHPLAILKCLSNTDKHRALVLHVPLVKAKLRIMMASDDGAITLDGVGTDDRADMPTSVVHGDQFVQIVDVERKLTTDVAFAQFGSVILDHPVVKGLKELQRAVGQIVIDLASHLA